MKCVSGGLTISNFWGGLPDSETPRSAHTTEKLTGDVTGAKLGERTWSLQRPLCPSMQPPGLLSTVFSGIWLGRSAHRGTEL